MKKTLLLISLFLGAFIFGVRTASGQTPYPTPTPTPSCGIGGCQIGETCSNCPLDCGTCPAPGYVACGGGTCSDGRSYTTYCTPSCTATPRTCYDNNSCPWPPPNCVDPATCSEPGFEPAPGGCCPPEPHCAGFVNCGVVICASGGNCYSDCSSCWGGTPQPVPTQPPGACFDIPPTTPQLSSPLNGASNVNPDLLLDWNSVTSWGTNCAGNVNQYHVYLDPGAVDPTTLAGSTGQSTTNLLVSNLNLGQTYSWKVEADNGVLTTESSTWSFTVTPFLSAWWQSQDGDVHSEGFLTTNIPDTCTTPGCQPYASLEGSGGYPGVVSSGGSANFGDGNVSRDPPFGWLANTGLPSTCGKYGYQGFYIRAGKPTSPAFSGALPGSSGVYFAGSNQTISSAWALPVGRSLVIFIDGNLTVNSNIDVPAGSFLAVVVSGNITFGPTVSSAEGIFVADGTITTAASANSFVGEGVFAGCGGFSLNRDYGDATNNTTPAEDFVWRPDLIIELLETILVREPLLWQEVAP